MNELKIFEHPEFGKVRTLTIDGEPWFVAADVCRALDIDRTQTRRLDDDEKGVYSIQTPGGAQEMSTVNEPGLYSLVLGSRKPEAKAFKRWITHDVIPSIRKHGGYIAGQETMTPEELMARALVVAKNTLEAREARISALEAENAVQRQAIADFQPIKQYVDLILSSEGTLTTTQIAADYDMTARRLNRILHEEGLQRNVNGQWVLYQKHMGKGYTQSVTIPITRSDGRPDTVMHTHWTQKGRLRIHEILTARGILAKMDRPAAV